jgi:NADPH-dependent 7-cyano-7-deazaguanine reductase QueF
VGFLNRRTPLSERVRNPHPAQRYLALHCARIRCAHANQPDFAQLMIDYVPANG